MSTTKRRREEDDCDSGREGGLADNDTELSDELVQNVAKWYYANNPLSSWEKCFTCVLAAADIRGKDVASILFLPVQRKTWSGDKEWEFKKPRDKYLSDPESVVYKIPTGRWICFDNGGLYARKDKLPPITDGLREPFQQLILHIQKRDKDLHKKSPNKSFPTIYGTFCDNLRFAVKTATKLKSIGTVATAQDLHRWVGDTRKEQTLAAIKDKTVAALEQTQVRAREEAEEPLRRFFLKTNSTFQARAREISRTDDGLMKHFATWIQWRKQHRQDKNEAAAPRALQAGMHSYYGKVTTICGLEELEGMVARVFQSNKKKGIDVNIPFLCWMGVLLNIQKVGVRTMDDVESAMISLAALYPTPQALHDASSEAIEEDLCSMEKEGNLTKGMAAFMKAAVANMGRNYGMALPTTKDDMITLCNDDKNVARAVLATVNDMAILEQNPQVAIIHGCWAAVGLQGLGHKVFLPALEKTFDDHWKECGDPCLLGTDQKTEIVDTSYICWLCVCLNFFSLCRREGELVALVTAFARHFPTPHALVEEVPDGSWEVVLGKEIGKRDNVTPLRSQEARLVVAVARGMHNAKNGDFTPKDCFPQQQNEEKLAGTHRIMLQYLEKWKQVQKGPAQFGETKIQVSAPYRYLVPRIIYPAVLKFEKRNQGHHISSPFLCLVATKLNFSNPKRTRKQLRHLLASFAQNFPTAHHVCEAADAAVVRSKVAETITEQEAKTLIRLARRIQHDNEGLIPITKPGIRELLDGCRFANNCFIRSMADLSCILDQRATKKEVG